MHDVNKQSHLASEYEDKAESLQRYEAIAAEMEKKVEGLCTQLQSYRKHLEDLPEEQSIEELYKVQVKMEEELKNIISEKEDAWRKVSVETKRLQSLKEEVGYSI